MAGLKLSDADIRELESRGARVRMSDDIARPAAAPTLAPPPPVIVQNTVTMDPEPLAEAVRDGNETMAMMVTELKDAMARMASSATPTKTAPPITGFDVQVISRDMDGAITRMRINVLRG